MLFPIGPYLLQFAGGGMYGTVFREYPTVVFLSINLLLTYIVPLIFTLVFIHKTSLKMRVPQPMPGKVLFIIGTVLILLPQFLRLLTSTIPGGGASFALMSMAAPFVLVAKLLIIIGAIKLFMSVKPSGEYVYPDS